MALDDAFFSPSLKDSLLKQAAYFVSRNGRRALDLDTVAAEARITPAEATSVFANTTELDRTLNDYLNSQCWAFLNGSLVNMDAESSIQQRMKALGLGFLTFAQEDKQNYTAYQAMEVYVSGEIPLDSEFFKTKLRPTFALSIQLVREMYATTGREMDRDVLDSCAMAVYAAVHGAVNLCTFGAARHLPRIAQRQLIVSVVDDMYIGIDALLRDTYGPLMPAIPTSVPFEQPVPVAAEMPKNDRNEIMQAMYRGAMECFMEGGLPAITVDNAAQAAGVSPQEAHHIFDGDERFITLLESHCDDQLVEALQVMYASLPDDLPPLNKLKASGNAFALYGMMDPARLMTHIYIGSASIVPQTFDSLEGLLAPADEVPHVTSGADGNEDDQAAPALIGSAYATLMEVIREVIIQGGGQQSLWEMFTQCMSALCVCHGITSMMIHGAMKDEAPEDKLPLADTVFDAVSYGLCIKLGLDISAIPIDANNANQ